MNLVQGFAQHGALSGNLLMVYSKHTAAVCTPSLWHIMVICELSVVVVTWSDSSACHCCCRALQTRHQEQQWRLQQLLQLWRSLKRQLLAQLPRLRMPPGQQPASSGLLRQQQQAMVLLPTSRMGVGEAATDPVAMGGRGVQQRGVGTPTVTR